MFRFSYEHCRGAEYYSGTLPTALFSGYVAVHQTGRKYLHTTDNEGTTDHGLIAIVRRDVRVAWRMARMLVSYVFVGGRIRRAVREAARRGDVYYVDDHQRRT